MLSKVEAYDQNKTKTSKQTLTGEFARQMIT